MWLDRRRTINRLRNVPGFIRVWDSTGEESALWRFRLRRSPSGNINRMGRAGDLSAPAIPYWHRQFRESLEDGVRELVLALIRGGKWISYTSCAGHDYGGAPPSVERHVGLLPRDPQEEAEMIALLSRLITTTRQASSEAVRPGLVHASLDDRGQAWPTLDLYIARAEGQRWASYFGEADAVMQRLIDRAKAIF